MLLGVASKLCGEWVKGALLLSVGDQSVCVCVCVCVVSGKVSDL